MDAKLKYLFELQKEKIEVFKAQDPATGSFDVVFDLSGELLYAHKFQLATISNTFNAMLSERWKTTNEPIKIQEYSYNNFKEFITFIYSGECNFTEDNIFVMVDIAEFYNVNVFKKACEDFLKANLNVNNVYRVLEVANKYSMINLKTFCESFLCTTELKIDNIYQFMEVSYQFSMDDLKKKVNDFISKNFVSFAQAEQIQTLQKQILKDVVETNQNTVRQEKLFEMVFKWAEKRALEKQGLNSNELIKNELNEFLPFIKFQLMHYEFLIKHVVTKSFLFTASELSNILWNARYTITIMDGNGKMMKGILNCHDIDRIFNLISSLKSIVAPSNFWKTNHELPSTPSILIKNDQIQYYLIYDPFKQLIVRCRDVLSADDYLLAEMIAEDGFHRSKLRII